MKGLILLFGLVNGLSVDYPFYHTTEYIHAAVERLKATCAVPIYVKSHSSGIDVVDIGNNEDSSKQRIFYLFGEHARELVSPETALELMNDLCSHSPTTATKSALSQSIFRIIPNGNPGARKLVESGQYCVRSNLNGVDLNRNWDANWRPEPVVNDDQLNPGSHPFSEVETRIFKEAVSEFNPKVFASIHSGTLGMYMPWAFKEGDRPVHNEEKMSQVIQELDSKFCQCPAGAAEKEVGYASPGTCLDWVHSHTKAEFSYAFEIFTGYGVQDLRDRYKTQRASLRRFTQTSSLLELEQDSCFTQFNPETKDMLQRTVNNWSSALIELAVLTASK